MQPRKLSVLICVPAYGGNGGVSTESPQVRKYLTKLIPQLKADPRIGEVGEITVSDTPITMVRNSFVLAARQTGCDLLLMLDSDMDPDCELKDDPTAVPFWDAAFNAIYDHYDKGPLVIGAPYCGPPNGTENVYVFYFENFGVRDDETGFALEQYPRAWAETLTGLQECAALPTGLILFDMRIFEDCEPTQLSRAQVIDQLLEGKITRDEAVRMTSEGWFYYEWKDGYAAEKASTEDVSATRDMALACTVKRGYNPLRCAWSSWAGHIKPWTVRKPRTYKVEAIAGNFQRAVMDRRNADESRVDVKQYIRDNPGLLETLPRLVVTGPVIPAAIKPAAQAKPSRPKKNKPRRAGPKVQATDEQAAR